MIITELYNGQGLGNQLWCYAVTRVIAQKNGYDFGIMSPNKFKGSDFLELDFGKEVIGGSGPEGGPPNTLPNGIDSYYKEKMMIEPTYRYDVSMLDEDLLKIKDNTKIDGIMQDENYIIDYKKEITEWFNVKSEKDILDYSDNDTCVIHVRGGDFKGSLALLGKKYYTDSIEKMKSINKIKNFVAVTDDVNYCKSILPDIEIVSSSMYGNDDKKANHHIGGPISKDFTILKNAKYSIIPSSSFSWWATWINKENKFVIAPKYWAAHQKSIGVWSTGGSLTKDWNYIDDKGDLFTYEECKNELLK
jgi:hypothetical protein